ncbi:hypothetical protein Tco_0042041, partial [Tanacetum coccineum]
EPAFLSRDVRHEEAFPTVSSLDAGQDMETIAKTSAIPHDSPPRVTSPGGDEGSMQQKTKELMEFCTSLQSQQGGEDIRASGEDLAADKEASETTDKGSESTGEMANILSSMGAANILANGGLKDVAPAS